MIREKDLPEEWNYLPINKVCQINPKKSEINNISNNTKITFLKMADIGEHGEIYNQQIRPLDEVYKGFTYFKMNDVLFAKITPCMENGKGAIARIETEIGFGSTEFHVLRAKSRILPEWIYKYLSLKFIRRLAESQMTGSAGQKRVPTSFFNKLKIPIPPIEKQKKIVSILEKAEQLKEHRKEADELTDDYLKSKFLEMFGDPGKNEKGWEIINFGNIISILTDYHANGSYETLRKHIKLLTKEDFALMVRTTDLENNNFKNGVNYITKEAYNFLEKSKIFGGEIIINKIGSAGKVYLMPRLNRPVSLGMNAFLLRFNNRANNIFIYYLLKSNFGEKSIQKQVKGAVTKTIRKDAVRKIKIPLPPIDLQNKFAKIVENVEKMKEHQKNSKQQIDDLYNNLMQKAFRGELVC